MGAVEAAGELVVTREEGEAFFPFVPLVDDPDHAVGPDRPPVRPGIPAAEILDPEPLALMRALRMEGILDAVVTVPVICRGLEYGIVPALGMLGVEEFAERRRRSRCGRPRRRRARLLRSPPSAMVSSGIDQS